MLDKIVDEHCYRTLVLLGVRVPIFVHALGPPLLLLSVQEGHVTLYTRATGLGSPTLAVQRSPAPGAIPR